MQQLQSGLQRPLAANMSLVWEDPAANLVIAQVKVVFPVIFFISRRIRTDPENCKHPEMLRNLSIICFPRKVQMLSA